MVKSASDVVGRSTIRQRVRLFPGLSESGAESEQVKKENKSCRPCFVLLYRFSQARLSLRLCLFNTLSDASSTDFHALLLWSRLHPLTIRWQPANCRTEARFSPGNVLPYMCPFLQSPPMESNVVVNGPYVLITRPEITVHTPKPG